MKRYSQRGHINNELEINQEGDELKLDEFISEINFVSAAMKEAGEAITNQLMDATIEKDMCGLGGCQYKDRVSMIDGDLVIKYISGKLSSTEVIYIAMNRVRVAEVINQKGKE